MKGLLIIVLLALFSTFVLADNWAVIVAGSNTYANYRHQSDVFHAYQILISNNFSSDRIITFAYDDIAHNLKNPFKGKVFNKPTQKEAGVDVYTGVKIDYSGKEVTPANFIAVLEGNKTAVAGKGTGRVLESSAQDNVFLYFADHGAPGLIAFPSHYLHADELLKAFQAMSGHYNKLVFYLEVIYI